MKVQRWAGAREEERRGFQFQKFPGNRPGTAKAGKAGWIQVGKGRKER